MYIDGFVFFFFKQKTAYEMRISDWSSDVCSSDLLLLAAATMLVMGAPVSAQETPDFEAIRSVDTDIAAIGYRLATANAPLCDRQESGLGLLLHKIGREHV